MDDPDTAAEIRAKLSDLHDDVKARLDAVAGGLDTATAAWAEIEHIKVALDAFDAEIGVGDDETPPG